MPFLHQKMRCKECGWFTNFIEASLRKKNNGKCRDCGGELITLEQYNAKPTKPQEPIAEGDLVTFPMPTRLKHGIVQRKWKDRVEVLWEDGQIGLLFYEGYKIADAKKLVKV